METPEKYLAEHGAGARAQAQRMADKKSLFAGRTGEKSSKPNVSPKRGGNVTPTRTSAATAANLPMLSDSG